MYAAAYLYVERGGLDVKATANEAHGQAPAVSKLYAVYGNSDVGIVYGHTAVGR